MYQSIISIYIRDDRFPLSSCFGTDIPSSQYRPTKPSFLKNNTRRWASRRDKRLM